VADGVERAGIQPVGERIVHKPVRHLEDARVVHVLETIALKRAEIVGVAISLRNCSKWPSNGRARRAMGAREMIAEVSLDVVVVNERVSTSKRKTTSSSSAMPDASSRL